MSNSSKYSIKKKKVRKTNKFLLLMFLISSFCCLYINNLYREIKNDDLVNFSKRIEWQLSEYFNNINAINVLMGKKIANHGNAGDLNYILDLFKEVEPYNEINNNILSSTLFDWVDSNNIQVVNSRGIIKSRIAAANECKSRAKDSPWTLQVLPPMVGSLSDAWIIPASTGVVDGNGEYLGLIAAGISIDKLTHNLTENLEDNIAFIIIDQRRFDAVVKYDTDNTKYVDNDNYRKFFSQYGSLVEIKNGFLERNFEDEEAVYSYIKKFEFYPYILIAGYQKEKSFYEKLINMLVSTYGQLAIILFVFIMMIYFKSVEEEGKVTK